MARSNPPSKPLPGLPDRTRDLLRVFDHLWPQPEEPIGRSMTAIRERRAADRFAGPAIATLARVTVYPGIDASVVNLSFAGALCESRTKLAPYSPVRLQIEFADRREIHVDGMVMRCSPQTRSAPRLLYRSAIRFFRPIALAGLNG